MIGGIEAGGTKFVLAVAENDGKIITRKKIPTGDPEAVITDVISFFKQFPIQSLAIGSFGPIGVDPRRDDYGSIKNTPKKGWANFSFLDLIKKAFPNLPVVWTTDVNVAAYGELTLGAGRGVNDLAYLTVGTGVGAGIIYQQKLYTGYNHAELGHLLMQPRAKDQFLGNCPYHGRCLEGMASGLALEKRIGHSAKLLEKDDAVWRTEAFYLAQACVDLTVSFAPEKIIFGGGVSNQEQLFPLIRESFTEQLANYVDTPPVDQYIVHALLGDDAGIVGALKLASEKLTDQVTAL